MITSWQQLIDTLEPDLIQLGDVGPTVRALQVALKALALYGRAVDGYFGPYTERALLQLQRDVGLAQTGKFDLSTWYALTFWVKPRHLQPAQRLAEKSLSFGLSSPHAAEECWPSARAKCPGTIPLRQACQVVSEKAVRAKHLGRN